MFGLPASTECKKQLPKKAIYAKFDLKPAQRESFDADISRIDIVGIVSPRTIPALSAGESIQDFYVLAVQLKRQDYDSKNFALLTKLIPQNMVLALKFEDKIQFAIHHSTAICSAWMPTTEATLKLSGLTIDVAWENLVKAIGQIKLQAGKSLVEQIEADQQRALIQSQIDSLTRKMAKEKQPRRKREYFDQIKTLKMEL